MQQASLTDPAPARDAGVVKRALAVRVGDAAHQNDVALWHRLFVVLEREVVEKRLLLRIQRPPAQVKPWSPARSGPPGLPSSAATSQHRCERVSKTFGEQTLCLNTAVNPSLSQRGAFSLAHRNVENFHYDKRRALMEEPRKSLMAWCPAGSPERNRHSAGGRNLELLLRHFAEQASDAHEPCIARRPGDEDREQQRPQRGNPPDAAQNPHFLGRGFFSGNSGFPASAGNSAETHKGNIYVKQLWMAR